MQVIFGPGEKTMRISVIFRGQGKRISPVEKAAYHKHVDVFIQENAWADRTFCMEWAKRSYREGLNRGRGELPKARSILIIDNLHAQTTRTSSRGILRSSATLSPGLALRNARTRCSQFMQEPDDLSRWKLVTRWTSGSISRTTSRGGKPRRWQLLTGAY